MGYELILTEKPSQAKKIAEALADIKPTKQSDNGVNYYIITHNGKEIVLASAVGHIYSLTEKNKSYEYPSYDIEWVPANKVSKASSHVAKYISVIRKLAKEADEFTVATDFDIEGEVIGLNMVRYACKQKDANRMKFSTLTKPDLVKAYTNKLPTLDWGQAYAGETRHFLDWMYGINLSRALSQAIRKSGLYKTLSSGRVQGPALKILVDREKEIRAFNPTPFWEIFYFGNPEQAPQETKIKFSHKKGKFTDEEEAKLIFIKTKGKNGTVKTITKTEKKTPPPFPFDLTTLQTEAYRSLHISPKETLAIAQELYTKGYTSYPRTSSQQLPKELGLKKLVESLLKNKYYQKLVEKLIKEHSPLQPNNGKKTDPAHPAIYPTGIMPPEGTLSEREMKIYDLIVRRFLSTFAGPATRETNKITIDVEQEDFVAKGTRTTKLGWFEWYGRHIKLEEEELPEVHDNETIIYIDSQNEKKMTKPPKRYTPASLIKELEKRSLGTKATRASIIDTLVQRGYASDKTLEPSEMGIQTSDIMAKNVPSIVSDELTRHFEEEMEKIRQRKLSEDEVLEEAKKTLTKILKEFKEKEKEIGADLKKSLLEGQEKENTVGPCPVCKEGTLMIKYSPRNKQYFIGCSNYPDCKTTFSLPGSGRDVKTTDKVCEECGYPMVKIGKGRQQRIVCINPNCPTKQNSEEGEHNPIIKELLKKPCPNCGSPMLLRKSMYGEFLGCSNYPKCKTIIQIPKNPGEEAKVIDYNKKAKKKTTKKATKKTKTATTKKTKTASCKRSTASSKKATKKTASSKKATKKATKKTKTASSKQSAATGKSTATRKQSPNQ